MIRKQRRQNARQTGSDAMSQRKMIRKQRRQNARISRNDAKAQRKMIRKQRRQNATESDAVSQRKMIRKQRRQNKRRNMLAKKGCYCFTPEQLQELREIISDAGRDDEFPELVHEEMVPENSEVPEEDVTEFVDEEISGESLVPEDETWPIL